MMVANVIWPFQKFGLAGCVVAFVYWPIALPLSFVVLTVYCLPTVYLTIRMFFYSKRAFLRYASKSICISLSPPLNVTFVVILCNNSQSSNAEMWVRR